jgi:hypothetical protein
MKKFAGRVAVVGGQRVSTPFALCRGTKPRPTDDYARGDRRHCLGRFSYVYISSLACRLSNEKGRISAPLGKKSKAKF